LCSSAWGSKPIKSVTWKKPRRANGEWNGPKNSQSHVLAERDSPRASIALLVKSKHDGASAADA